MTGAPILPCDLALGLSPDDVLQHHAFQGKVRNDLIQPPFFVLELLDPLRLSREQARILLLPAYLSVLPAYLSGLADSGLPADLDSRCAFFDRVDDESFLHVRRLRCLRVIPLLTQPGSRCGRLQLQTVQTLRIR